MGIRKKKKADIIDKNLKDEVDDAEGGVRNRTEATRLIESSKRLERSRADETRSKMRMAYIVAGAVGVIALLEGVAITSIMPLKTVEPYVIKVDKDTGATQIERPLNAAVDADEAMERFFLRQYINAHESFGWYSVESNFNRVRLMSTTSVFSQYAKVLRSEKGALNVLGESSRAIVKIKNITFLDLANGQNTAQVRFIKRFETESGEEVINRNKGEWLATVSFDYSQSKLSQSERDINPLNFRVTNYRLDLIEGGDDD